MKRAIGFGLFALIIVGTFLLLNRVDDLKYYNCSNIDDVYATVIIENDEEIVINFSTLTEKDSYDQTKYHFKDGVLYVGVQFSLHPLEDDIVRNHNETITLEEAITKVILKGPNQERQIYPLD